MKMSLLPLAILAAGFGLLGGAAGTIALANAARNSSGTYSLPTGNPVVSGTTISSTWANNTLSDVSTELTDSLSRSNKGAMLAQLKLYSGTAGSPGLAFGSDASNDSGLYLVGANNIGLSLGGTKRVDFLTTGTAQTGTITATGTISSSVASGSNGLAVTANGARIDFGAGASDYASSDGTTVGFAGPVSAANVVTTGAITAGTSLSIGGGTAINSSYALGVTIDFPSVSSDACAETTTPTTCSTTAACAVSDPGATALTASCRCSATDTLTLRVCNSTAGAIDQTSQTYRVRLWN